MAETITTMPAGPISTPAAAADAVPAPTETATPAPTPTPANNAGYANNPANQWKGQALNPGAQQPYSNDPFAMISPQAAPGQGYANFLPAVFRDPYLSGMNAAAQVGTAAGAALPNLSGFQSQLYGPGLTGMEQAFMGAAGEQGLRGLNQTLNRVEAQFENSPMHGALAPAMMDAANQFAQNMMTTGSQMGTQRQTVAAQMMPSSFQVPLQAAQASQQGSEGLYNMLTQAMYGDLQYPAALYGQYPFISPTVVQGTSQGKGK